MWPRKIPYQFVLKNPRQTQNAFALIGCVAVVNYSYIYWYQMKPTRARRLSNIKMSDQITWKPAKEYMQLKALYWNLLAIDGVNSVTLTPHDAWFWGFFMGAGAFAVCQVSSLRQGVRSHVKKLFPTRQRVRPTNAFDPLGEISRFHTRPYQDLKYALFFGGLGFAINTIDYHTTDVDTRDYLRAAFPQYDDEIISELQQNHDATCRMIATIINNNPKLLNTNDMKTVAIYVAEKTETETHLEDAHTWIGYSPVMTMQYLLGELDALELGVCVRRFWLRLKGVCSKCDESDWFETFGNGKISFLPSDCPANWTTKFCPRKLLADLFITMGTLGTPFKFYLFWSEDDLEYRGFLISYGKGHEKGMLKRSY